MDLNIDSPESKASSTSSSAVSPSSDSEAHKLGKRLIFYRFLNVSKESNEREDYPASPSPHPLIYWEQSDIRKGMLAIYKRTASQMVIYLFIFTAMCCT